MTIKKHFAPS